MNHYRAAVIGCGGQGSHHANAYTALAETKLVAATDVSLDRATRFAGLYHTEKVYSDWREMLRESAPDVISICTPAKHHTEIIEGAVKAGVKAILCEKPMADTFEAAKRAHHVAQEAGVLLTYCHQRRFENWYIDARTLLRDGAIGELVSMEAFCSNLFD